jgi:hypothetical protein
MQDVAAVRAEWPDSGQYRVVPRVTPAASSPLEGVAAVFFCQAADHTSAASMGQAADHTSTASKEEKHV